MSDDLPTFDRPMKANSGTVVSGHWSIFALLVTNCAEVIARSILTDISYCKL